VQNHPVGCPNRDTICFFALTDIDQAIPSRHDEPVDVVGGVLCRL
jgi:hypothetical protein